MIMIILALAGCATARPPARPEIVASPPEGLRFVGASVAYDLHHAARLDPSVSNALARADATGDPSALLGKDGPMSPALEYALGPGRLPAPLATNWILGVVRMAVGVRHEGL